MVKKKIGNRIAIFAIGMIALSGNLVASDSKKQKSIRDIDLKAYIVARDALVKNCEEFLGRAGEDPIHFWEVEYADLDGDGSEEAVIEAATCVMGTGGCDVVEVLKLLPNSELQVLEVTHEGYSEPPEYDGTGSTPRMDVKDGQLVSWYVIHAKTPGKPKRGWTKTLLYRWKDNRFVVDRVMETPPLHPEYFKEAAQPSPAPDASRR